MKLYSSLILLILVMNPLGNIPVFLSILKPIDPKRHTRIIIREVFIAFLLLAVFMLFGQYLLRGMQISEQALGISGGIILFLIAIRMIFPEEKPKADKVVPGVASEPFIVPLAIPMAAGPAAMTTVMLFMTQHPEVGFWWILVLILASLIFAIVILSARYLSKIFSEKGLTALERLSGMMLTAMAIQMFLTGIESYFRLH
jgi:multiple antibiotic resistance protein